MVQTGGHPWEYGCHEGNYGIVNILNGARAADKKSTEASERTERR